MRLTITKKIAFPFVLILILIGILATVSLIESYSATKSVQKIDEETLLEYEAWHLHSDFSLLLMAVNDYIITGNKKYQSKYEELTKQVEERFDKLERFQLSKEERNLLIPIRENIDSVNKIALSIFQIETTKTNNRASALMEKMDYLFSDRIQTNFAPLHHVTNRETREAFRTINESNNNRNLFILWLSIFVLAISVVVIVLTIRRISAPLLKLVELAQHIAVRDFSAKLRAETEDEIGMLIVAFNVMAEEINRRYEELESFASIAAHDLKSPLMGVRGFSEILLVDYCDKIDENGKASLQAIIASSDSMAALVNNLLLFARAGKIEFGKEPVSQNSLLHEIKNDLMPMLKSRNAKLLIAPDLPSIFCDPIRFGQVWKNLIGNAIKYNEHETPTIEIGWMYPKGESSMYLFSVKDNGIGIDADKLDKIFMPFQRATTSERYEGTGIGLSIVKRVVENHGGRVWVESKPGEGTTFYFTVPKPPHN